MKLIAHRGLTDGPNKDLENSPEQILKAIDQGFDCEIDLWIINS
jgi:glycerophosphoryl diester phosphodiesterase